METTVVRKVKRGNGCGRWPAYVLGEDPHGLWLYCPAGTIYRGQVGQTVAECDVGQGNRDAGLPVVHLVPGAGWWIATWSADGAASWISVDICTPPALIDGEWTYIDLELDPHAYPGGLVEIEDEDEFAAACQAGVIPPHEQLAARAAATEVTLLLRAEEEPFGRAGWEKLHEAVRLPLPPLRRLP